MEFVPLYRAICPLLCLPWSSNSSLAHLVVNVSLEYLAFYRDCVFIDRSSFIYDGPIPIRLCNTNSSTWWPIFAWLVTSFGFCFFLRTLEIWSNFCACDCPGSMILNQLQAIQFGVDIWSWHQAVDIMIWFLWLKIRYHHDFVWLQIRCHVCFIWFCVVENPGPPWFCVVAHLVPRIPMIWFAWLKIRYHHDFVWSKIRYHITRYTWLYNFVWLLTLQFAAAGITNIDGYW